MLIIDTETQTTKKSMGLELSAINVFNFISGHKYKNTFCLILFFFHDLVYFPGVFLLHLMAKILMRPLASGLNPGLQLCLFCLYAFEDMATHS